MKKFVLFSALIGILFASCNHAKVNQKSTTNDSIQKDTMIVDSVKVDTCKA